MHKSTKRLISLLLGAVTVCSTALPLVGCKDDPEGSSYDPETNPLVFSTDALDGNFNPFFATSATDVTIAAQTQISMITTDAAGNPVCGEDQATVALDHKITEGTDEKGNAITTYEFIIKNGIKFSDGTPLTIKDVLFNLYVYLDPMYMGSATIYSTKIKGLNSYRYQTEASDDTDLSTLEGQYDAAARQRIASVKSYLTAKTVAEQNALAEQNPQILTDIAKAKAMFKEEVESDWTACSLETYAEEYRFTEKWEAFYFQEGLISVQYEVNAAGNSVARKDENGKYLTSLDPDKNGEVASLFKQEIEEQLTTENIAAMKAEKNCTDEEAKEYIKEEFAIEKVYGNYAESTDDALYGVLTSWRTATDILEDIAAEEKSKAFESAKQDGELMYKTISGITTKTTTRDFDNKALTKPHDVLSIVINGVDPKAIWNFAFSVAPMHYYSTAELAAEADGVGKFGVKFGDKTFFDEVLQAPEKNALPMGAGAYQASNATDSGTVTGANFFQNNWVYFKRNEYFDTVGDELNVPHIKYIQYKVVSSEQLINSLVNGEIHVGSPNAKPANITEVNKYTDLLKSTTYRTNGYGYVGINPKYVPDIEVRQAIMKAMDTASIVSNYYTPALADTVYRSMSMTSDYYPKKADGTPVDAYESVKFDKSADTIKKLVESAANNGGNKWTLKNGVYTNEKGERLKITFTIAGETKDHPAYDMFMTTAKFLNEYCGFDVTVTTDVSALKKLAQGELQVWAAAWSSSIDPDLYQVYHKDSTATSVKNWGYPTILADQTGQFQYEQTVIEALSEQIEAGRETTNVTRRKEIYATALDMIMQLAVELPTYQRNDLIVYNKQLIDVETINTDASPTAGVFDRIWEVNYN